MVDSGSRSTRSTALRQQEDPKQTLNQPASTKHVTISSGTNHPWTDRERIVLRLLNEFFPSQPDNRTIIFNAILADEHTAAGFSTGRDAGSLRSQWSDKTRPGRSYWDKVKAGPQGRKEEREWRDLENEVRRVAKDMGVAMRESEQEEAVPRGRDGGRRSKGRVDARANGRTPNAKLKQQAIGRARKGGKFVKEQKAQKPASNVEEQHIDGGGMDLDQPIEPDDINDPRAPNNEVQNPQHDHPHGAIPAAPPLPMIHTSQVEWASTDAFWTASARDGLTHIPTTSAIYAAAGKVHRVLDINSRPHDYMLCNPRFCSTCSTTATASASASASASDPPTAKTPTSSLPFVHAKDVQRIDGRWNFTPSRGEGFDRQTTAYTAAFPRNVVFVDGAVRTVAVCTYAQCRVCREHTLVQKQRGVDPGGVAEG